MDMKDFILRNAIISDMYSVHYIQKETMPRAFSRNEWRKLFEDNQESFFVIEINEAVIGYAVGKIAQSKKLQIDEGHIMSMAIINNFQKKGFGTLLLNRLIIYFRSKNVKRMVLEVREENKEAYRFYLEHGFSTDKQVSNYYENGDNAKIMRNWVIEKQNLELKMKNDSL